jgi:pimeloyl-ACP methyl ester carboxylesterase
MSLSPTVSNQSLSPNIDTALQPEICFVNCVNITGTHRLAYAQWGDASNMQVVICAHGLSRNGRDFDPLAQALVQQGWRVICPDMIGRGRSDWMQNKALYTVPQYVADCSALIASLKVSKLAWVGTSMGGIIGMVLAADPKNNIETLVLNDIGPVIDPKGLLRISDNSAEQTIFKSFDEAEAILRGRMVEFGPHSDADFRYLSRHYIVQREGVFTFHFDPDFLKPFKSDSESSTGKPPPLWDIYDAIKAKTLVLRGEHSDIFALDVAQEMTRRGPHATLHTVMGVGHAPTLIAAAQMQPVLHFLK